jgi:cyclic 2,3-diphosphoglycerate synthetase
LAELPYEFVAAVFVGGTEKLRDGVEYGVPLAGGLEEAISAHSPDVIVDLSDEPVLGPRERFLLASRALALGVAYVGADFRLEPPQFEPFALPSLAVAGTGKRVGKTAVATHAARLLARDREVVVVSMGRGGPAEPELVEVAPTLDELLTLSRAGRHAASDHLETAALAGVPTIGCRRCGGGLAGSSYVSNVVAGARLAAGLSPDLVLFDGSGAAIPPVVVGARILVAHDLASGLNPYRALVSDLVLTMDEAVAAAARALDRCVLRFDLRLQPVEPLAGRPAAVVTCSPNLADRELLRRDLDDVDAEVYVVELKAAAIDVVAETAAARGVPVVFAANEVIAPGLDEALLELADLAIAAEARKNLWR